MKYICICNPNVHNKVFHKSQIYEIYIYMYMSYILLEGILDYVLGLVLSLCLVITTSSSAHGNKTCDLRNQAQSNFI